MLSDSPSSSTIVNAMTVDVEDYFQVTAFDGLVPRSRWPEFESRVSANTDRLLEIFAAANVRGTFFVLGWVASRFPDLVGRIASAGHELASHGYSHRLIYDQTPDAFREDVRRAKAVIEDAGCMRVRGYRAPSYSVTPKSLWALDILAEEGYHYDASIFPIHHDRYGIPRSPRHPYTIPTSKGDLIEAPASTVRIGWVNLPVAGGGYFRILPYAWTRWGMRRINERERRPAIFYVHPWELDPEQPRLHANLVSRFRHYCNLDKTATRLRTLLADFRFGPIETLLRASAAPAEAYSPAPAVPYL